MTFFPGHLFTTHQLEVMRSALIEAAYMTGLNGDTEGERALAYAILAAAHAGCFDHDDLVAVAINVGRRLDQRVSH